MLRSLALASLLLAPVSAQEIPFPGGGGVVGGRDLAAFPVEWDGKPAILLLGGWGYIARYDPHWWGAPVPTPILRLAGVFCQDWRPCASQPWSWPWPPGSGGPTSEVHLEDSSGRRTQLGLMKAGQMLYLPGLGLGPKIAFEGWTQTYSKFFRVSYCRAAGGECTTNCLALGGAGPQFMAVVLVIEGMGT